MTFSRYLRIWRELNAVSLTDIADELNLKYEKVRNFDRTNNSDEIMQWYFEHGLKLEDFYNVQGKYKEKKEQRKKKKNNTAEKESN